MANRHRGMGLAAGGTADRRRKEILEFVDAPGRGHVLVRGHAADRAFVHVDGLGDVTQHQRTQVLHAFGKKTVLLAHDLGGHLEDGGRPLMKGFHQPVGRLEAAADVLLVLSGAGGAADLRVVVIVDQDPGQGVAVEFDDPAAAAPGADEHVGRDRLGRDLVERERRLRVQRPDLGHHVGHVVRVHAAHRHQRAEVPLGHQVQVVQQGLHGRVQAVPVP